MRDIVKPFIESLGVDFVSDEETKQGYRARIERNGQKATVVVSKALIETDIAEQLEAIQVAWKQEAAFLQDRFQKIQDIAREIVRKKGFKGSDVEYTPLVSLKLAFMAGGERRVAEFTQDDVRGDLEKLVEARVNSA